MNGGLFVSPGYGLHPTRVLNSYELIMVVQGRLELFEESNSFAVAENEVLLLDPGRRHGAISPYGENTRFYWLHFFRSEDSGEESQQADSATEKVFAIPKKTSIADPDRLMELFHRFISDQESGLMTSQLASRVLLLILLEIACQSGEIAQRYESGNDSGCADGDEAGATSRRVQILSAIDELIEARHADGLSVKILADAVGYSADYLERIFRDARGETLIEAINRRRIETACRLLREHNELNVNEISSLCGYRSPAYFHRRFHALVGVSPKRFRSLYPRTHINSH